MTSEQAEYKRLTFESYQRLKRDIANLNYEISRLKALNATDLSKIKYFLERVADLDNWEFDTEYDKYGSSYSMQTWLDNENIQDTAQDLLDEFWPSEEGNA